MGVKNQPRAKMSSTTFEARSSSMVSLLLFLIITAQLGVGEVEAEEAASKVYIVYMGARQHADPKLVTASHHELVASVLGSKEAAAQSILYSYKHGFSGFSAVLTDSHAKQISEMPGVVRVTPSRSCEAHTTRSWDFLGLSYSPLSQVLANSNQGDGVIIGVVDSGIWPESRSFSDIGYGPIPSRWKGTCEEGVAFNASHCNRKIIGARWYARGLSSDYLEEEYLSPRDMDGHGTGTASAAAGSAVNNISFEGLGSGLARGGAPRARLAIYKVLWGRGGSSNTATVLAAVDDAIHDGVDILSLSLSFGLGDISYGWIHAAEKGITVVFSAGNDGPRPQSLGNTAPWVVTVAASTIDRSFPTPITLGNNVSFTGQSAFGAPRRNQFQPLAFLPDNPSCDRPLNATLVRDKVVLCFTGNRAPAQFFTAAASGITQAGGAGLILAQYTDHLPKTCLNISCFMIDYSVGLQIDDYIQGPSGPQKSSGEDGLYDCSRRIICAGSKDVAAPGVNILAAYRHAYALASGTSIACPHVSGIAALIKSLHPDWSPAAIKSALVTTASTFDEFGSPIIAEGVPRKIADPFDFGGGHVNPNKAVDPGLVYDIDAADYSKWEEGSIPDLNLPSISIPHLTTTTTVTRTVTNVGPINATFMARIQSPHGVRAVVAPSVLTFNATAVKHTFQITFTALRSVQGDFTFGSLIWSNNQHIVRIPITAKIAIQDSYADVF
ncbi:hypothetical protein ACLOJK_004500 [Asimina triloba]